MTLGLRAVIREAFRRWGSSKWNWTGSNKSPDCPDILSNTSGLNELGVGIGQAAIEIKVEIEKLREQVQNIA
jgi:hypothetical protein